MDERGRYKNYSIRKMGKFVCREDRPSMYFAIKSPDGVRIISQLHLDGFQDGGEWGFERMNRLIMNDEIDWRNGKPKKRIFMINF